MSMSSQNSSEKVDCSHNNEEPYGGLSRSYYFNPDRISYDDFRDTLITEILEKYGSWKFVVEILIKENILWELYRSYRPTTLGWWHGAPFKWRSIFNWMSCPASSVRAIVLLMEPKLPTAAEPLTIPNAFYCSTGYALGVTRENLKVKGVEQPGQPVDITAIPTVWNFIDILCYLFDFDDVHRDKLKERYHDGFDPAWMSEAGILFLNVFWTRRRQYHSDREMWWPITKKVLEEINNLNNNVIVFQLYSNKKLSAFLDEVFKHRVIRPEFMKAVGDNNEGRMNHLGRFEKHHLAIYADEIKKKAFHFLVEEISNNDNGSLFQNLKKALSLFYTLVT